ncbi:DsbA family protein [Polymorphum gilvum]|uniref:Twin-arginine translocation pathway signal protein n=1 Tax=Polymorphum gilvum (strain LMG 25793 / CGMCC 1.9160 / SL003B-26A1) TaxID=991905 RepID=F2IZ63_POLGS|nr:DsbA family protein [Polymorphum gilvum]ADZ71786.1 Twin-arginine translocation pathway signal protein [Polymorphum gilvum SL003B-26A1]
MTFSRRQFLQAASFTALGAALATVPLAALAETYGMDKLMEAGPLGDKILGADDAPVTIVEYASMTCGHCATFHKTTYPVLKKDYVDTGKVRFIFREFPLDPVATAAFMLARCAPEEKYFDIIDALFEDQRSWAYSNDPYNSLLNFAKQVGFTQEAFEACLTNQDVLDGVNAVRDRAASEFKVNSTPTFFVNGEKKSGALTVEQMAELIDKHL